MFTFAFDNLCKTQFLMDEQILYQSEKYINCIFMVQELRYMMRKTAHELIRRYTNVLPQQLNDKTTGLG